MALIPKEVDVVRTIDFTGGEWWLCRLRDGNACQRYEGKYCCGKKLAPHVASPRVGTQLKPVGEDQKVSDSVRPLTPQRNDAVCQNRTHAPHRNPCLLDHLVGEGEQRRRHGQA